MFFPILYDNGDATRFVLRMSCLSSNIRSKGIYVVLATGIPRISRTSTEPGNFLLSFVNSLSYGVGWGKNDPALGFFKNHSKFAPTVSPTKI